MSNMKNSLIFAVLLSLTAVSAFVEELDDTFMETNMGEMWLIKFYTPWCTFCKQMDHMWHDIGSELKSLGSPVHVGKLDCTAYTNLAKEFLVRGYPTIAMLKDDVKYTYQGARTKDDIIDFANRIAGPAVRALTSPQLFQHVMSRHDVLFVYVGASSPLKGHYIDAAKEMIVHTNLFSTTRDVLPKAVTVPSLPAVAVFKDGTYYTYNEERDGNLTTWMNRERFLSYFKIDSHTLYSMGDTGKLVALALVDKRAPTEEGIRYKTLLERVATDHKELYNKHFQFGYMDGNEYINGLIMGEVAMPSIIVVNLANDGYYLPLGPVVTMGHLTEFLNGVLNDSIECQGGNGIFERAKRLTYDLHLTATSVFTQAPLLGCVLVCIPVGAVSLVCYVCCKKHPDYDDDDDEEPLARGQEQRSVQSKGPSGGGEDSSREPLKKLSDKKAD